MDGSRSKLAAQEGYLHRWLQEHKEHPYPSDEAVQKLALQSNLSVKQVQKWLENSRKRKQLDRGEAKIVFIINCTLSFYFFM